MRAHATIVKGEERRDYHCAKCKREYMPIECGLCRWCGADPRVTPTIEMRYVYDGQTWLLQDVKI